MMKNTRKNKQMVVSERRLRNVRARECYESVLIERSVMRTCLNWTVSGEGDNRLTGAEDYCAGHEYHVFSISEIENLKCLSNLDKPKTADHSLSCTPACICLILKSIISSRCERLAKVSAAAGGERTRSGWIRTLPETSINYEELVSSIHSYIQRTHR